MLDREICALKLVPCFRTSWTTFFILFASPQANSFTDVTKRFSAFCFDIVLLTLVMHYQIGASTLLMTAEWWIVTLGSSECAYPFLRVTYFTRISFNQFITVVSNFYVARIFLIIAHDSLIFIFIIIVPMLLRASQITAEHKSPNPSSANKGVVSALHKTHN